MNLLQFLSVLVFGMSIPRSTFVLAGMLPPYHYGTPGAIALEAERCIRIFNETNFRGHSLEICHDKAVCVNTSTNTECASANGFYNYPAIPKIQSIRTTSFGTAKETANSSLGNVTCTTFSTVTIVVMGQSV